MISIIAQNGPPAKVTVGLPSDSVHGMDTAIPLPSSRTLWSVWSWLAIGSTIIVGLPVMSLLYVVTLPFDRRRYVTGRAFRIIGVVASKLTPMWRFGVDGELPAHKPRRVVCVSNHCSAADPFLLSYLPWEMKWLSKASNFKIPIVGWMLTLAGDVSVERGTRQSAKTAMAQCRAWLDRGMPVMIFPEGTRSKDGQLLPFKDGAFRLAIEAGADILPMAVVGTESALRKHDWRLQHARAAVRVGEAICTNGMSLDDVDELKQQVRQRIEQLREELARHLSKTA